MNTQIQKQQLRRNLSSLRGFTLVELLVVIAIIAALAGLAAPGILNARKAAAHTEAVNNIRQVGLLLTSFENDFDSFPDPDTATKLGSSRTGTSNSNDPLAQIIEGEYTTSEKVFGAKGGLPDGSNSSYDDKVTDGNALQPGECGIAYVMNGTSGFSSSAAGGVVVLATPMTDTTTFNPAPYNKKCAYLRIDSSVESPRMNLQNKVLVGTQELFAADDDRWGINVTPTVLLPAAN